MQRLEDSCVQLSEIPNQAQAVYVEIEKIKMMSESMNLQINDTIDLFAIRGKRFSENVVPFQPMTEINKVASIVKDVRNPFTRVLIRKQFTGFNSSTIIYGESKRLKQVLLNCLQCCLDKTQRGNISIEVKHTESKYKLSVKVIESGLSPGSREMGTRKNSRSAATINGNWEAEKHIQRAKEVLQNIGSAL